jgi:modification methylase
VAGSVLALLRGPAYESALERVLLGCAALLRPDGTIVVVTTSPVASGTLTDLPGLVIRVAGRIGLAYIQHIIAVTAQVKDSRLLPWPGDGVLGTLGADRAHEDVLVFTRRTSTTGPEEAR